MQKMHHLKIQKYNFAQKEYKKENNFFFCNLNSIEDPNVSAYIHAQQV